MTLRSLSLLVACAALAVVQPAAAALVVPSIEILSVDEAFCNAPGAALTVYYNMPTGNPHSDTYEIYVGPTLYYRYSGESGNFVGVYEGYGARGGAAVPANTRVSAVIYSFNTATIPDPFTPNVFAYRSRIDFDCTTGEVFEIVNNVGVQAAPPAAVPALGAVPLAVLGASLLTFGLARRRWLGARRDPG